MYSKVDISRRPYREGTRRNKITDGSAVRRWARSVPKSVSAEMTVRPSEAARSKNLSVVGSLEGVLADMHRIVAGGDQLLGDARRQRVVDQESQPADASGSSRSRTASAAHLSASELAVVAAFSYVEGEACFTHRGRNGIRRVRGDGFLAAAYRHRLSRAGDSQLDTHVVVANMTPATPSSGLFDVVCPVRTGLSTGGSLFYANGPTPVMSRPTIRVCMVSVPS
jgi:TrwC relaxase